MTNSDNERLDPRVIRTRRMLREALMDLIVEQGYDTVTVQAITERATLNRATFYLHYQDKDDLLRHIIGDVLAELALMPIRRNAEPNADEARRVFAHLFDHVAQYHAFYSVMLLERSVASFARQMQREVEAIGLRWMHSLRATIPAQTILTPPELFVSYIGAAYLGVVEWWLANDRPYTPGEMAEHFMRLTLVGMHREFGLSDV